jgi:hypothetical protein
MIDDDDVDFSILASEPTTWLGAVLTIVLVVTIAVIASNNKDECAQRKCDVGHPAVVSHECMCVTESK